MDTDVLKGGFSNAPVQSAQAFRAIMTLLARPGEILGVQGAMPPAPLSVAAGVTLITLCDPETPLFLAGAWDCPEVRKWIAFHIGAPIVPRAQAHFAVGSWKDFGPVTDFAIGTPQYPDRSATLIVELETLSTDGPALRGPGIKTHTTLSLPDVETFQANATLFPLGLDFLFTSGTSIAGLPRTTKVEAT
ncbi:phosphonate C-P lyase system protein PhnH [Shimia litoralis]|uniref:Phosphonate C-P lyase system protein PhnH n=1 Tax=Shimia litoralis TaxID=420403 RepID=A0A4U7N9S7_9RHOB|nr:phosphonate C-P lyase system protein PhnH [Shimia litoralis]TKZ22156.1 phosphonate C-P lyase system protein PhnH [Shimia litoralis]